MGDSCTCTPSIFPPCTNLYSSVPANGFTQLGLRSYPKVPMAIKIDDELCNDLEILANEFNKYFTEIASNILNTQTGLELLEDYKPPEILRQFVTSKLPHDVEFSIPMVTEGMMLKALSTIDTSKAAGLDQMIAKLLRISAPVMARHLAGIINISITTGVFLICGNMQKYSQFLKQEAAQI